MENVLGGPVKIPEKLEIVNPTGNASYMVLRQKNGTPYYVFVDNSGILRTSVNPPQDGNEVT